MMGNNECDFSRFGNVWISQVSISVRTELLDNDKIRCYRNAKLYKLFTDMTIIVIIMVVFCIQIMVDRLVT